MTTVTETVEVTDTRTHWVTSIGGVTREFDAEIVEQVPDQKVPGGIAEQAAETQPGGVMGEGPAGGPAEMPGERPGPGW